MKYLVSFIAVSFLGFNVLFLISNRTLAPAVLAQLLIQFQRPIDSNVGLTSKVNVNNDSFEMFDLKRNNYDANNTEMQNNFNNNNTNNFLLYHLENNGKINSSLFV